MLRIGKQKPFKELQNKDDWICHEDVTFDRKTRHAKSIICGKLYNTEKSEIVSWTQDKRTLFMTGKGIFFPVPNITIIIQCMKEIKRLQFMKFRMQT